MFIDNRLTGWDNGSPYVRKCFEGDEGGCEYMNTARCNRCEHNLAALRRLAGYEDSGLSPEELTELLEKLTDHVGSSLPLIIEVVDFVLSGDLLKELDRLAEYESIGLSPKQVRALWDGLNCLAKQAEEV